MQNLLSLSYAETSRPPMNHESYYQCAIKRRSLLVSVMDVPREALRGYRFGRKEADGCHSRNLGNRAREKAHDWVNNAQPPFYNILRGGEGKAERQRG